MARRLKGKSVSARGKGHILRVIACVALLVVVVGCSPRQMLLNEENLGNGLIIVLPGIDGLAPHNMGIWHALGDERLGMAVEHYDWTMPLSPLYNQSAIGRNHKVAARLARRIALYRRDNPSKPVFLVAHSGGTAIAAWAAEALSPEVNINGIIMLASSLSPWYDLRLALNRTRHGIVSFYSDRDTAMLGRGTSTFGTMDRQYTEGAGKVGFVGRASEDSGARPKLFQIAWTERMAGTGYNGGHFSSCSKRFIASYVGGLIRSQVWNQNTITALMEGRATIASAARTTTSASAAKTATSDPTRDRPPKPALAAVRR